MWVNLSVDARECVQTLLNQWHPIQVSQFITKTKSFFFFVNLFVLPCFKHITIQYKISNPKNRIVKAKVIDADAAFTEVKTCCWLYREHSHWSTNTCRMRRCHRCNAFHNKQSAPALLSCRKEHLLVKGIYMKLKRIKSTLQIIMSVPSLVFLFLFLNFLLYLFSSPKALRLECWQQICYSVHQITSSRWWRIKDSERKWKSTIFPNVWKTRSVSKKVRLDPLFVFFFSQWKKKKKKNPRPARQKDVSSSSANVLQLCDFCKASSCAADAGLLCSASWGCPPLSSAAAPAASPKPKNPRVAGLSCAAGAPRDAKEFYFQSPGPSHIITWCWKRKIYRVSVNDVWSTSRPCEALRVETSPPDLCFFAAGLGRWANPLPLALQLSWRQASNVHLEAPP